MTLPAVGSGSRAQHIARVMERLEPVLLDVAPDIVLVPGDVNSTLGAALAVRLLLVWQLATPNYFPDEYLYAALARSLAGFHGASVRGHAAHFPALLQPLLTAPAWRRMR